MKVAIAEDDFRVALIHEKFLQKIPEVEVAAKALNAKETLEMLNAQEIDLLLLDVYLPDKLGTDLLPIMREKYPEVDIILITAATEKKMIEKAMNYGVDHFLIKPVTMEKFMEAIEAYQLKKNWLNSQEVPTQEWVDKYFEKSGKETPVKKELPAGVDYLTLENVKKILISEKKTGLSAEEVAAKMGASRTTARRYLEYLVSIEIAEAKIHYGIVGRPERKYCVKEI
ncbi:response regulator [Metabacillus arenae]|uniref:Response regulator n=1 Tax=Metabacillus arenae TaxID=2771434 RepID=A0A926RXU6_9BACI|nr:response regulator [Metabacillus arenae]MBD1380522.1 response regulator [Metabacillus arenae]